MARLRRRADRFLVSTIDQQALDSPSPTELDHAVDIVSTIASRYWPAPVQPRNPAARHDFEREICIIDIAGLHRCIPPRTSVTAHTHRPASTGKHDADGTTCALLVIAVLADFGNN